MMRASLILSSVAGMVACVGCNAAKVFSVASDVTGAVLNTTAIAGGLGLALNLDTITGFIQSLLGGL